jgi:hypothetical protein
MTVALFLFLTVRTYLRRKDIRTPRWMGRLQTADAGFSFRLGLLLGKRAEVLLPRVRHWMTGNSWVISELVIVFFLALAFSNLL